MIKAVDILIGVLLFSVAHILTFFQLNGQFLKTNWFRKNEKIVTTAEINYLDTTSIGTVDASKAVIVDSNKDIAGFRNISGTGIISSSGVFSADGLPPGSYDVNYEFSGCSDFTTVNVLEINAGLDISACVNAPTFNLSTINTTAGGTWSGCSCIQPNGNIDVGLSLIHI